MEADKLVNLIEQEMDRHTKDPNGTPEAKLTWKEYLEDIAELPSPTEKQIKIIKEEIESNSFLGRSANNGWKIVAFLSSRQVGEKGGRKEESVKKNGYLTYIVIDEKGNLVHGQGNGKVANIIPEELLKNAAIIEISKLGSTEIKLSTISITSRTSLEECLRNSTGENLS